MLNLFQHLNQDQIPKQVRDDLFLPKARSRDLLNYEFSAKSKVL